MAPEYLAGIAAVLAATLSAVSLYFTRRWQQSDLDRDRRWREADEQRTREWHDFQAAQEAASKNKVWALDNLKEALVNHINLSFKIGRVCSEAKLARAAGSRQGVQDALDRANARHTEYMDLMVYLRLFSTPSIVKSAERLHRSLDHLLDLTFSDEVQERGRRPFTDGGLVPENLTETDARANCMDGREELINHVREYLGLPPDAEIERQV